MSDKLKGTGAAMVAGAAGLAAQASEQAKGFNAKHNLTGKATEARDAITGAAGSVDEQFKISENAQAAKAKAATTLKDLDEKHKLSGLAAAASSKAIEVGSQGLESARAMGSKVMADERVKSSMSSFWGALGTARQAAEKLATDAKKKFDEETAKLNEGRPLDEQEATAPAPAVSTDAGAASGEAVEAEPSGKG
jgi:hypothetical protein